MQVVFQDVGDCYPNDSDIVCRFLLCLAPDPQVKLQHKPGDRIGVFKVPYIRPDQVLCLKDVTNDDVKDGQGCLTFKGQILPKEEDFYQFQYLRLNEGEELRVLGASVPFQLRKPKSEELCTVQQSDSEFMLVQTTTALAAGQLSDKIGDLQSEKEELKVNKKQLDTWMSKALFSAIFD